jgi:hypothetical protein
MSSRHQLALLSGPLEVHLLSARSCKSRLSSLLQASSKLGSLDVLYSTTLIWNYHMCRAYNAPLNPFNVKKELELVQIHLK